MESYFAWVPVVTTELAWRTHTYTLVRQQHTDTQCLKLSYSVSKVTYVMEKGSLMPLVLGNWRVLRDSLAKTSIILSAVPLS